MRYDFQKKRQLQQPVRGQSSQQPAKRPFYGPPKVSNAQGSQQQRPQGQQRQQQQGASAPRPGGYPIRKECSKQHSEPCMAGSGRQMLQIQTRHYS
ncbi:hypothetical protein F511_22633 [Dorcoceras hygrometricum]|uniref:Uncharacterized protein n=1 Tax=Dorcoceras hygrometricum TaxID=472368 RepID=A0A2Z7CUM0_9LAMI|nr:hypothetical protein F511_22633 [Dorcoceras hygrometricum]